MSFHERVADRSLTMPISFALTRPLSRVGETAGAVQAALLVHPQAAWPQRLLRFRRRRMPLLFA
jgi:hypothetical protein